MSFQITDAQGMQAVRLLTRGIQYHSRGVLRRGYGPDGVMLEAIAALSPTTADEIEVEGAAVVHARLCALPLPKVEFPEWVTHIREPASTIRAAQEEGLLLGPKGDVEIRPMPIPDGVKATERAWSSVRPISMLGCDWAARMVIETAAKNAPIDDLAVYLRKNYGYAGASESQPIHAYLVQQMLDVAPKGHPR